MVLAAVLPLVLDDGCSRCISIAAGPLQQILERKPFAPLERGNLSGLHPVIVGDRFDERGGQPLLLGA
ncbi:MAG TPA: hypothetical protein VL282_08630, partial [Tepidisphaeraceae bacterium]|nr:hypothetical protein [Tepidisphaeraceae bacterium]